MTTAPETPPALTATVLSCSLRRSSSPSSSEQLGRELAAAMDRHSPGGVHATVVRVADHDVRFGVSVDEGDGDGWPALRRLVLGSDILVLAVPIWMGQTSSVAKMVLERLDAEISETDEEGRPLMHGKVAAIAVVGNEDGAHHVVATCAQALNDVGFSIAANGCTYWVGEAMHGTDYRDLPDGSEQTTNATEMAARATVHLAALLKAHPYPAPEGSSS